MQDTHAPSSHPAPTGLRLSKRVVELQHCSRTEAEALITQGRVRVDGAVIDLPQSRVLATQSIVIQASGQGRCALSIVWHKPAHLSPPPTEASHVPGPWLRSHLSTSLCVPAHALAQLPYLSAQRWGSIAAMAQGDSGLWLLTQDGRLFTQWRERLERLEQEWLLDVEPVREASQRESTGAALRQALHATPREQAGAARISWQSDSRLRLAVRGPLWCRSGAVAQLANELCAITHLSLLALRRQRLGAVSLRGLQAGQWRTMLSTERL